MFDRSIRTEVVIASNAAKVYEVLTDFPSYPSWNPFIVSIEGTPEKGTKLKAEMVLPGRKGAVFTPTVLSAEPGNEFRWVGSLPIPGLFTGEHFFLLKEESPTSTLLVHGEHFSGLLIPVVGGILAKTEEAFKIMNKALKEQVESQTK